MFELCFSRLNEDDDFSRDCLAAPNRSNQLAGLRLDVDLTFGNPQQFCEASSDGRLVRSESWLFRENHGIDVFHDAARWQRVGQDLRNKFARRAVLVARITVGKPVPNVAFAKRAEQCVHECVQQDVAVAMSNGSAIEWHNDPAEHQRTPRLKPMRVVPNSHPERHPPVIRLAGPCRAGDKPASKPFQC